MAAVRLTPSGAVLRIARRDLRVISNAADRVVRELSPSEIAARMGDGIEEPRLGPLRERLRTLLAESEPPILELVVSADELGLMNDVLNQVCNAFPSAVDFAGEIGATWPEVRRLLTRVHRGVHLADLMGDPFRH